MDLKLDFRNWHDFFAKYEKQTIRLRLLQISKQAEMVILELDGQKLISVFIFFQVSCKCSKTYKMQYTHSRK